MTTPNDEPELQPVEPWDPELRTAADMLAEHVELTWEVPLVLLRMRADGRWVVALSWNGVESAAWRQVREAITELQWRLRRSPGEWANQ